MTDTPNTPDAFTAELTDDDKATLNRRLNQPEPLTDRFHRDITDHGGIAIDLHQWNAAEGHGNTYRVAELDYDTRTETATDVFRRTAQMFHALGDELETHAIAAENGQTP